MHTRTPDKLNRADRPEALANPAQSRPGKSGMRKKRGATSLLLPLALCGLALWIIFRHDPALLAWSKAWPELLRPLTRMLAFLGAGLVAGLAVEGMGWSAWLAAAVRPLMRFGRLRDASGAAFATAFFSGTAANAMLMNAWRDGRLGEREMRLSYLVNTGLPVFLLHLPTTFFVVVPMTRSAGAIYLALNAFAAILRTLAVLAWTRATLLPAPANTGVSPDATTDANPDAGPNTGPDAGPDAGPDTVPTKATAQPGISNGVRNTNRTTPEKILTAFRNRFWRIITITVPVYLLMYALNQTGVFEHLRDMAAHWVVTGLLPVEAVSVVVFAVAAEFTSGIAAAGALLDAGTLTTQQAVLALVLGTIVATPIRAIRHQLPSHAGVFTPRLGLIMLLQSQFLRVGSLLLVTAWYVALA